MVGAAVVERLADIPPGPALSAALAAIELAEVGPEQIVDVVRAQSRQSAHEQARFWVSLVEVGLRRPPEDDTSYWGTDPVLRAEGLAEWASGEVAAGLTWTSRAADQELGFAETVVRALPDVLAALWAGEIDRGKAVVSWTPRPRRPRWPASPTNLTPARRGWPPTSVVNARYSPC